LVRQDLSDQQYCQIRNEVSKKVYLRRGVSCQG